MISVAEYYEQEIERLNMSEEKSWTTKYGTKIPLSKMGDTHLLRTIKYIEMRSDIACATAELEAYSMLWSLQGECAIDSVESAIACLSAEDFLPDIYHDMIKEAKKRNLF